VRGIDAPEGTVEMELIDTRTRLYDPARVQRLLTAAGVDAVLGATLENVYYLSQIWSENFEILPRRTQLYVLVHLDRVDAPTVISPVEEAANIYDAIREDLDVYYSGRFFRYVDQASELSELSQYVQSKVIDGSSYASLPEATAAAVRDAGLDGATIAYDEHGVFPGNLEAIRKLLPGASLVPGADLMRRIRAVKTAEEQSRLRRAAEITEAGIAAAIEIAAEGVRECELMDAFEHRVLEQGGRLRFAQIQFGERGATGYVMNRTAPLRPEEIIRFDVGCAYRGYTSDIARNFSLTEPPAKAQRLHEAMLAGEEAAVAALRPGVPIRDVVETALGTIRELGVPDYDRTHIGHGLGLDVYDFPILTASTEDLVEPGMVVAVETPYYELGFAGLHPEDPVRVTETGAEYLTQSSRALAWRTN
jgi:Xaa-Pro aminopeptidase